MAIYVENTYLFAELTVVRDTMFGVGCQATGLTMSFACKKIIIICINRPPNHNKFDKFNQALNTLTEIGKRNCDELYVCGDFNFDFGRYQKDNNITEFYDTMLANRWSF